MDGHQSLLNIKGLTKDFRGLRALDDIDLTVGGHEILGVIGPNGAGKTTLFNVITGLLSATHGAIQFLGKDITRLTPDAIARLGIARTFQNIRLFDAMSVLDNVRVAQQMHVPRDSFNTLLSTPIFLKQEKEIQEKAIALLSTFNLAHYWKRPAGSLPYGDQRRLEIVRALATQPRLLLLDEPTVGMNPSESQTLLLLIQEIFNKHDLSIILVAHDMQLVMNLCQQIQVLNQGKTIALGTPAIVRNLPQVIEAYLGSTEYAQN